jgi:heat shock protein HslJ
MEGGGQEPAWRILVTETLMTLSLDLGSRQITVPVEAVRSGPLRTDLRGASGDHALEVSILRALCRDTMSGMPHPLTLDVRLDGQPPRSGCGGDPAQLLRDGEDWFVLALAGQSIVSSTTPTLRFQTNAGEISGNASCNRFRTSFERTGESLTLAAPTLSTRMTCDADAMEQEARLLSIFSAVQGFDISPEGFLVLKGPAGNLVAGNLVAGNLVSGVPVRPEGQPTPAPHWEDRGN